MTTDGEVKTWCEENLYQEAKRLKVKILNNEDVFKLKPDVMLSVNYTRIVPPEIVKKFRVLNLHSLLPRFRGRNAVSFAIINARKDNFWQFGATLHAIDEGVDTGEIIKTKYFNIDEKDTAYTLYKKWEKNGFELIKEMLPQILDGNYQTQKHEGKSYYYDRSSIKNKEIDLSWSPDEIYDRVRAYTFPPFEGPYIKLKDKKIYLNFDHEQKEL